MSKTFVDMFYNLKENRNPALSLADYDEVVLSEAELHAKLDGRFAAEYITLLTTNRPDGSPAIINNPKFQGRVSNLVEKLNEAIKLNVDTANWFNGNVASLPKTDRTKLGSDIFDKEYRIRKSQGMSNADAFLSTTMSLMTGMQKNEPIKQIEDLLAKPVTGQYTEDNKLALEVYAALDKAGITGIYFKENDKNKYLFYVANVKSKAGQDPRDIVRELGTANTITKQISQLTSEDKKSLQTASGNMAYAPNQELFYMVAQYFKNINTDINNDDYINQTKDFIDKHYSNINGRWVSKFKINQLGTTPDKYDTFKISAIELLKEKLNVDKKIIQEVDLVGFSLDETNIDVGSYLGTKIDSVDLNNYELIVDDTRDTLYFKESDGTLLDVPATVEYKNGQTVWLEVPIDLVKQRIEEKEAKQREINNNLRMKKDAEFRKKQKRLRELESMGVSAGNLGQGELFKF